ncbi:hypothetical protein DW228_06185 [Bacteroides fragilis]|uniref:Phage virion morphogenesis family protein n=1 Tax=Bacteroides fragilis TaxID=817 RepID=A0A396C9S1_BACFG|nr:hypothetical protein [Bacteroides fragilis]RHH14386.1 hypothetical protein DW228_06185 [Bacteroides fragilis]
MIELTPQQFISQWVTPRKDPILINRLQKNMTDFVTSAGQYSKSCFQASFFNQGFYRTGQSWKPRQSKWGKRHIHPLLMETGNLFGTILGETGVPFRSGNAKRHNGTKIKSNRVAYTIYTKEGDKNTRKSNFSRGYAAIHNTDPKLHNFKVNKWSNRKPVQRQFIGFNYNVDGYIYRNFVPMLFEGFPK